MESHFSGLEENAADRRRGEKNNSLQRQKNHLRAIGSVIVLILAVTAGAGIAESVFYHEQHFVERFSGAFGCGALSGILMVMAYATWFSLLSVDNELDTGKILEDRSLGRRLWLLAMGAAWLTAPLGAVEGLWLQLPGGMPILAGGYAGGLVAVIGILLAKLARRGMLG